MEEQENQNTAEGSGSTGGSSEGSSQGSAGDSTVLGEPVQPLDIDASVTPAENETKDPQPQKKTSWKREEVKKLLSSKMRKTVCEYFHLLHSPKKKRMVEERSEEAAKFFMTEFPNRTPYAVYQKAMIFKKKNYKRIILA